MTTITRKKDIENEIEYWRDARKSAVRIGNRSHADYCSGVIAGLNFACN